MKNNSKNDPKERKITIMVISIVGVFLLSNLLNFIFWSLKESNSALVNSAIFLCMSEFLLMINPCVNCLIYSVCSIKFRDNFFDLFCSALKSKKAKEKERERARLMESSRKPSRTTVVTKMDTSQVNSEMEMSTIKDSRSKNRF